MVLRQLRSRMRRRPGQGLLVTCLAALLVPGNAALLAQEKAKTPEQPAAAATEPEVATIPPGQLDSLVAPIALYPDDLLAQVLAASTYPLEIIQLQQWLKKNPGIKDKALADAVARQPWDPSIQTMAAVPDVVNRLADDIQWTTDLGNAFLAQQSDVMDAVQRMRAKAKDKGALESNQQQKVETKVVEQKTVIIVESADPEVIYVPSYSPVLVYGVAPYPYYPYPPIYYPPYPPGGAFITFGVGVWMGAAIWGGSCCGCGWGHNDVNININNNFNRNTINTGNVGSGGNTWSHNSQHRGGAPYANKATASKYGGSARGDSLSSRQAKAGQQGGSKAGAGNRATSPSTANKSGSPSAGNRSAGGAGSGAAGPSTANRGGSSGAASHGGGDSIGSRSIPKSSGSSYGGGSSFSGGSRGYSGSSARSSSSRGASSMGSRGGGSRGGGGRR